MGSGVSGVATEFELGDNDFRAFLVVLQGDSTLVGLPVI